MAYMTQEWYISELLYHCMPQSSFVRLRVVYGCPLSCLAFFMNTQANDIAQSYC